MARGAIRNDRVLDPGLQELPCGQPRPLEAGPGFVPVDEEAAPLLLGHAHRGRRSPVIPGRQGAGVTVGQDSGSVADAPRPVLAFLSAPTAVLVCLCAGDLV